MPDQLMGRIEFAPNYNDPRFTGAANPGITPGFTIEHPVVRSPLPVFHVTRTGTQAEQDYPPPNGWYVAHDEPEGFFDLPAPDICRDARHSPPSHMVIPPGKGYRHRCPSCGRVSTIIPPQVTL